MSLVPSGDRGPQRYFPEVESLRGVAIALVFLYHVAGFVDGTRGQRLGLVVSPLRAFVHGGQTGVSLFFVLSAFLLSLPFLAESAGNVRVNRRRYYERRALRILPLYWTAVMATSVAQAHRPTDVLRGAPYLFFLNSLPAFNRTLAPLNAPWWSLATEVQFYLLLPLLPSALGSRRGRYAAAVGLLGYVAVYVAFLRGALVAESIEWRIVLAHSVFGRAPVFAAGILVAGLFHRFGDRMQRWCSQQPLVRAGGADAMFLALLVGLGCLLRQVVFHGYWEMELAAQAWHVLEGVLWGAVLFLLLVAPVRIKPLFANRPLAMIGLLSYSIYLVHVPLLYLSLKPLYFPEPGTFAGWHWTDVARIAALAAACLAVSTMTYRVIERPFLVRKAKIGR